MTRKGNGSRYGAALVLLICVMVLGVAPARSSNRVALVIGNGAYGSRPLANPVNDATDIADVLEGLGFDVIIRKDATRRTMLEGLFSFADKLKRAEIGLFFYAGHGVQIDGINYLVPIGADIRSAIDVEDEGISANRVLGKMEEAGTRLNMVILDACRDNPFPSAVRSSGQGLARMEAPVGSIIAYATSPGSVALDGNGRNGVFTKHLLTVLNRPDLTVREMFDVAGLAVMRETGRKQVPWLHSSPMERVYLAGGNPDQIVSDAGSGYQAHREPATTLFADGKEANQAASTTLQPRPSKTSSLPVQSSYAPLESINARFPDVSGLSWKAASVFSKGLSTFHNDSLALIEEISDITGGRMKIKLYPAGELVRSMQVFDAVAKGSVEAGIADPKYWKGKDEAFVLISSISSCLAKPAEEQYRWLIEGQAREMIDRLFDRYGIVAFPFTLYGPEGLWSNKRLDSVKDLEKLRIRTVGHQMDIFNELGSTAVPLPGGEVKLAMERGVIDAVEFSIPSIDERFGMAKVADHYYYPSMHQGFIPLYLMINKKAWQNLTRDQQEAIRIACHNSVVRTLQRGPGRVRTALDILESRGSTIRAIPGDIQEAYCRESTRYYERLSEKETTFGTLFRAYRDQ